MLVSAISCSQDFFHQYFNHSCGIFQTLPLHLMQIMGSVSEAQILPPVQVFDKTMVVKQMHVLEPQDLLISRADKGMHAPDEGGGY